MMVTENQLILKKSKLKNGGKKDRHKAIHWLITCLWVKYKSTTFILCAFAQNIRPHADQVQDDPTDSVTRSAITCLCTDTQVFVSVCDISEGRESVHAADFLCMDWSKRSTLISRALEIDHSKHEICHIPKQRGPAYLDETYFLH